MNKLIAFQVDEETIYAARNTDEAMQSYHEDTGEVCDEGYPEQVSDALLDAPIPELDEDEAPTGSMITLRAYLDEMTSPGFLASSVW